MSDIDKIEDCIYYYHPHDNNSCAVDTSCYESFTLIGSRKFGLETKYDPLINSHQYNTYIDDINIDIL